MLILGLDPGRGKMGWALVDGSGGLVLAGICPRSECEVFLAVLARSSEFWKCGLSPWLTEDADVGFAGQEKLVLVAVGNGTGSLEAVKLSERLGVDVVVVDESGTTLEARGLYWTLHAPAWWQVCLPRAMRLPCGPLDDLAAWAIARRSLGIITIKSSGSLGGNMALEGSNRCCGQ